MKRFNSVSRALAVVVGVLVGGVASATPAGPYDGLTAAVDFDAAQTAVLAVFGIMAGIAVAIKGGSIILRKLGWR